MPSYSFSDNEFAALQTIADKLAESGQADADTSNAIQKIQAGSSDIELTDLERIGLQSMLSMQIMIEEASGDAAIDLDTLRSAVEKLSS